MEFILFIVVIVLLFWIASVSNRVAKVERLLAGKPIPHGQKAEAVPVAAANMSSYAASQTILQPEAPKNSVFEKPKVDNRSSEEVAAGWLNKIGVTALVLGVAFFFKLAIDKGWISEWMRVLLGILVGGLLVYLGELWKEKYGSKAHALAGGGIAVLYFSVYAAFSFYGLIPLSVAFLAFLLIAALAVFLSYRYSSVALGILGFFGAYGAPVILNGGRDQQIFLFTYLSILNLAALVILYKKYWLELLFFALFGSAIDFIIWGLQYSTTANTYASLSFAMVTTVLVVLGGAILTRIHSQKGPLPEHTGKNFTAVVALSGIFYVISIWVLLDKNFHDMLPAVALLGSVLFFVSYAIVDRIEMKAVNYSLSFFGTTFLLLAACWQFEGKALAFAFLLIALLGSSIGVLLKREELRVLALFVLFLSLFKSLYEPYGTGPVVFLFNAKFGLMFANTLAFLLVGWLYKKVEASSFEQNAESALQIVASIMFWVAVSWDISTVWKVPGGDRYMALWWVLYPLALGYAAMLSKRTALLRVAMFLVVAGLIKVFFMPYFLTDGFIFNMKFGLLVLETISLLAMARYYKAALGKESGPEALQVIGSMLLWWGVSAEIVRHYGAYDERNVRNLTLTVWWILYGFTLMVIGSMLRSAIFRKVALVLFVFSILKVFVYDVQTLDIAYRVVSFIVLGVILLLVSFAFQKNKEKIMKFIQGEGTQDAGGMKMN